MQTFRDVKADESDSDDPEENTAKAIKKRHRRELQQAERENRENTSALLELRDMEDELTTLWRLFETQTQAIDRMRSIYMSDGLKDITHNGRGYLTEALARLEEYKTQTNEMLKRVDTTRKDVSGTLVSFLMIEGLTHGFSTRKCSKWPSVKLKLTMYGGLVYRLNLRVRRIYRLWFSLL